MPRLFLFDGTAIAYRSYHALSQAGLSAPDGRPTGAIYGFTTALRRILETESPDLVAVAFDPPGGTFRHERYPEYKATRDKTPEDLREQMPMVREVVRRHGIPIFEVPGYEADDVIGTLATQAEAAGYEVQIVTGDKDLMQLVSDKVVLYDIFKRGQELVIQDLAAVEKKFGTTPEHVPDVLAIMGDTSDNVPGVKGIGEKGAIKLVAEFGSVAGVLENIEQVKGKTREKLEDDRENLLLSLELVQIDKEVPLESAATNIEPPAPDSDGLHALFLELGFHTLLSKLAEGAAKEEADEGERDFVTVRTPEELESMIAELREAGRFAVDTETTSLMPLEAKLVGVSFSARAGRAFYVPFNVDPPVLKGGKQALLDALEPLLTDPSLERIGQNYKYDALVFEGQGIRVPAPDFDTVVASFCVAGADRRHSLDDLALHYFNQHKIPLTQLTGTGAKKISVDHVPLKEIAEYGCEDAEVTFRLAEVLARELEEAGAQALYHDLELPLVPVLGAMERRGIALDEQLLVDFNVDLTAEMEQAALDVQELAGENFNVNSNKVLGEVLFEKLRIQDAAGVKKPKRTKTGWSTDAATLSDKYPDEPIVKRLLAYRELAKLKSTYVDSLPRYVNPTTGRIHCSFSQVSAATGRLACSDPNLQNIPVRTERGRKLREAFVPRPADEHGEWLLLAADYSQIELRVMAHFSGDEDMIAAFEAGHDIHTATAKKIFELADGEEVTREMRSRAKVINFGLLYGMGPQRVARETNLTVPEAREFIERYFGAFPKVREWITNLLESGRETGYVETLLGRRRSVADLRSQNSRIRNFAENAAVNTPIQGSAADVIKRAMIDVERELTSSKLAGRMILQVHDELLFEVPAKELDETRELVVKRMEEAVVLAVPLKVDCGWGANWLEAH